MVYLKKSQEDMMSLVFKKLNLCPVMPASWGVNPLATSHATSHFNIYQVYVYIVGVILYLIYNCFYKIDIALNIS